MPTFGLVVKSVAFSGGRFLPSHEAKFFDESGTFRPTKVKRDVAVPQSDRDMAERGVFVGRQRNPWLVVLLSVVTLLLYFLYWLYAVNTEVRRRTGRKIRAERLLVVSLLFPFGTAFSMWRTARHVRGLQFDVATTHEVRPSVLASIGLIVPILGYIPFIIGVQNGLNEVWRMTREGVERGALSQELRCPSCDAIFTVNRGPFLSFLAKCPSCAMEGTI